MMEVGYWSVYEKGSPYRSVHLKALYDLLCERTGADSINISHKEIPSYHEHLDFVESKPYYCWDVIVNDFEPECVIGSVYISEFGELGIFIFNKYQGQGYGSKVLELYVKSFGQNRSLLANINPRNEGSIKLFKSLGFEHIQNTYRLEPRNKVSGGP